MRMNLETETFQGISDAEREFLEAREAEADRLKQSNTLSLDQFTIRYITDEQKYIQTELNKQAEATSEEIEEKDQKNVKSLDLDQEIKRDLESIRIETDILKEKEKELWRIAELVEGRREVLSEKKQELIELKNKLCLIEQPDSLLRKQFSFINWGIDGNSGDIDFDGQFKKNLWLSNYYLDSRLKYGNICMKILAILQISGEKDSSDGFIEFIGETYAEFLRSPYTCSHASVEQLSPIVEKILQKNQKIIGLQVFPWLLLDTGIGAFLPFKEVSEFLDQMIQSRTAAEIEEVASFMIDHAYWFLQDQIITNMKRYHGFLKRLSEEIEFKRKPKQFNVNPSSIKQYSNFNEVQKRLARALASQDSEAYTGSALVLSNSTNFVAPLAQQYSKPVHSKSAKILFRITHGSGLKSENSDQNANGSRYGELSTNVTHHSSKIIQTRDHANDVSQHTFKVLMNQYHQSIRGLKEQPQFNFKSLNPIISNKHVKGLIKTGKVHRKTASQNLANSTASWSQLKRDKSMVSEEQTKSPKLNKSEFGMRYPSLSKLQTNLSQAPQVNTSARKGKRGLLRIRSGSQSIAFGVGSSIIIKKPFN